MTAAIIARVTYGQALRLAVEALDRDLVEAAHTSDQLEPGVVWSALQDVCIEIGLALGITPKNTSRTRRMTHHMLPTTLRDLYKDAQKRSVPARGGRDYQVNFGIAGLIHTVGTSLTLIPAL
ncbi:MAG: hypothetical protein JWP06_403 [Candidatus Saccharibacteria bacterium]|nr:hypothetical protein [Candidatus Saccharibacteria bacterium]